MRPRGYDREDELRAAIGPNPLEPDAPLSLCVLYRDDDVIVVDKPSGLAVHRGWAPDPVTVVSLARGLLGAGVFPIHRLDRATSGALILGLRAAVARRLQDDLAEGRVSRRYLALVRGIPQEEGSVDSPLRTKPDGIERRPAVTDYRRLFVFRNRYSLVEARPRTGRYHQIRRHMKKISCHLIGDVLYGKGEHNRLFRSEFGLHRLALHAFEVTFPAADGRPIRVTAPLPPDLAGPFRLMGVPLEFPAA